MMQLSKQTFYFLACLAFTGSAFAHAMLDSAKPGAGAVLEMPPAAIVLHFDSTLETAGSRISVDNAAGKPVVTGPVDHDKQDDSSLRLRLPTLPPGHYHVNWQAVTHDGHRSVGDYTFTIH